MYLSQSVMVVRATPEAIAAFATAGATSVINLGSVGFGIIYSGPYLRLFVLYAWFTDSGTGCFASSAMALTAAIFISSLIVVARTSSAPLKMYGNPNTLFTWFGKSDRPVAIITSLRVSTAVG